MTSRLLSAQKQRLAETSPRQRIAWRLPRWDYRRKVWRQAREILNRSSLIRIASVSLVVGTAVLVVSQIALPQQNIAWNALLLLGSFLSVLLILCISFASTELALCPRVTVRSDRIHGHDGRHKFFIEAHKLLTAFIYVHPDDKVRLKLRYRGTYRDRVISVGVPPDVDLNALASLLMVKPVIHNVRSRRR